jgi:tetratricopeptide (TPR) repeat protein
MDCRASLMVAFGLLAAGGCAHQSAAVQPAPLTTASVDPDAKKAPDRPKRTPQAATLVSLGDVYQRGARESWKTPAQKEQLLDQARKAYQQALKVDPKFVAAHLSLARLYETTDDHERAVASYHSALDLKPKDAAVWHSLGMCHARKKEWDPAIESLTRASDLDSENKSYSRALGFCLARAGHVDESFKALCHVEDEAQAHFNLAQMLHHVQQDELSKQHLRLALQTNPQLSEAQRLLAELEGGVSAGGATASPEAAPRVPSAAGPGSGRS